MNIIGLGEAGCRITKLFQNYPQYETYFIDTENKNNYKNFLKIKEQQDHEAYENDYKQLNFKKVKGDVTVILCGTGKITGVILRLLEQLKDKKVNIIYVKPDMSTAPADVKTREKIVFGVLQEYARSNLLSKFYIFSNNDIEGIIQNISISSYWDEINNIVCSTYHMLNVFDNMEPLLSSMAQETITSKIIAPGVVAYENFNEKLFYDLDKPRLKKYFFGISEKSLNEEKDLLQRIRTYIKSKAEDKCGACFAIYPTSYEENYIYTLHYASLIQEQNIT